MLLLGFYILEVSLLIINKETLRVMIQVERILEPKAKVDILMWQVTRLLIRNKKLILEEFGLTCSQFEMLSAIYTFAGNKDEIIQVYLSEKTGIDPMTTSTILRNLQKKGLIIRNRSIVNTRTVIVELTKDGKRLYEKALSKINVCSDIIYQDVNENTLISQLTILSDKLNKLNY